MSDDYSVKNRDGDGREVLDAEIVNDNDDRGRGHDGAYRFYQAPIVWYTGIANDYGCLGAFITIFLFILCMAEWGVLAGIGFLFFYAIGCVLGVVSAGRRLMFGLPFNLWIWRCGNWIVSFLLTCWLAGGFPD